MGMTLHINNDSQDLELNVSGVNWVEVDKVNDYFLFSGAGAGVADSEDLPTEKERNRAAVEINTGVDITVPKYFLADFDADKLCELFNAGNQNKRYVFCVDFDDETLSEPQLELWDTSDMLSATIINLGSGTPSNSWYKGTCTTDAAPGDDWTGTPLAGLEDTDVLPLNAGNGALDTAKKLYFNFKIIIPSSIINPQLYTPIMVITYLTN